MDNLQLLKMFLSVSVILLAWILIQLLLFVTGAPTFLETIFSVLINFNLLLFILLPAFLILSLITIYKRVKYGYSVFVINLISNVLFFSGNFIIDMLK